MVRPDSEEREEYLPWLLRRRERSRPSVRCRGAPASLRVHPPKFPGPARTCSYRRGCQTFSRQVWISSRVVKIILLGACLTGFLNGTGFFLSRGAGTNPY